jgi:hypothetical protein
MKPKKAKRQKIFDKYDNRCAYCGSKTNTLTLDHIVPKSWGGTYALNNLVPCCPNCNTCKGSKNIEQFRKEIEVRLNPNFKASLNHKPQRILKGHPKNHSTVRKWTQSKRWLDTVAKFAVPVVFYFEKTTTTQTDPVYTTMGGFGFTKPVVYGING